MRSSNNNQTKYLIYSTTFVPNKINNSNNATTGRVETHELVLESVSFTHTLATLEWARRTFAVLHTPGRLRGLRRTDWSMEGRGSGGVAVWDGGVSLVRMEEGRNAVRTIRLSMIVRGGEDLKRMT